MSPLKAPPSFFLPTPQGGNDGDGDEDTTKEEKPEVVLDDEKEKEEEEVKEAEPKKEEVTEVEQEDYLDSGFDADELKTIKEAEVRINRGK